MTHIYEKHQRQFTALNGGLEESVHRRRPRRKTLLVREDPHSFLLIAPLYDVEKPWQLHP